MGKLTQDELGEQTVKWIEKNGWPQRVLNSGGKSGWKPVTCSVSQQWCKSNHSPPLTSRLASLQATATYPKKTSPPLLLLSINTAMVSSGRLCPGSVPSQPLAHLQPTRGGGKSGKKRSLYAVPALFSSSQNRGVLPALF